MCVIARRNEMNQTEYMKKKKETNEKYQLMYVWWFVNCLFYLFCQPVSTSKFSVVDEGKYNRVLGVKFVVS